MKQEFLTLILWLVSIYALICEVAYFGNRMLMYFPDPTRVMPAETGLNGVKEIEIAIADGEPLIAWYAPAKDGNSTIVSIAPRGGSPTQNKPLSIEHAASQSSSIDLNGAKIFRPPGISRSSSQLAIGFSTSTLTSDWKCQTGMFGETSLPTDAKLDGSCASIRASAGPLMQNCASFATTRAYGSRVSSTNAFTMV